MRIYARSSASMLSFFICGIVFVTFLARIGSCISFGKMLGTIRHG
jgi:hypothetical protein